MINTSKFIQKNDYINNIKKAYTDLIKKYNDGDLIEVSDEFSDRDWFYMEYDKELKKYIFCKNELDKMMELYMHKMDNDSFYMKFYVDAQNRNLSLFLKKNNKEIGTYIPSCKILMINEEYSNEYNEIKKEINTILDIKELSSYEVKPYNN